MTYLKVASKQQVSMCSLAAYQAGRLYLRSATPDFSMLPVVSPLIALMPNDLDPETPLTTLSSSQESGNAPEDAASFPIAQGRHRAFQSAGPAGRSQFDKQDQLASVSPHVRHHLNSSRDEKYLPLNTHD